MLNFVLAAYSSTGQFLGYQYLKNQFSFCETSDVSNTPWLIVGHNYQINCNINIANVVNSTFQITFYDMFLIDDFGTYLPIPVRILNMQQNQYGSTFYYAGNTFVRRFFLIDNISGVSNGKLKVLRVPTAISFRITQAIDIPGKIYMPIMDITYGERVVDGFIDPTDTTIYASPTYNFTMAYSMSLLEFWGSMQIVFSLMTAGLFLCAIYRTLKWSKRNTIAGESLDVEIIVQSAVNICGCAGATYFWFLALICGYWLFFYKGQSTLYLLIPTSAPDIYIFSCTLAVATIMQTIYVSIRVYSQCKVSMFFFDWEKSRGHLIHSARDSSGGASSSKAAPVSIWRTIFMANQWRSLQCMRKTSIEFQLVWMYFILDGMHVQYAATPQPDMHNLTPGQRNPILIFAVDCGVWLLLVTLQILFRYLVYDRFYRDRFLQFADLLSVSNISLLIFDEKRHGYYVHGRSVHHAADTDISELNASLRKEENDMVPNRGLDQTDQQVFEIFVTPAVRSTYDKIYGVVVSAVSIE
ncbi:Meckelin [Podochytrium sp. JEL0797]|nr:Meckelin [Podochytrium sp. JEL0797]